MFATLDPILRKIRLPSQRRILMSDTVGFIRNLPTTLVDAFRATLEEVTAAALLLHVVDISSPDAPERVAHVLKVLAEIGAEASPQLLVLNKSDQLPEADRLLDPATLTHRLLGGVAPPSGNSAVLVSAQTGAGLPALLQKIDELLVQDPISRYRFRLPLGDGRALHLLHERAAVLSQIYEDDACEVVADVPQSLYQKLAPFRISDA